MNKLRLFQVFISIKTRFLRMAKIGGYFPVVGGKPGKRKFPPEFEDSKSEQTCPHFFLLGVLWRRYPQNNQYIILLTLLISKIQRNQHTHFNTKTMPINKYWWLSSPEFPKDEWWLQGSIWWGKNLLEKPNGGINMNYNWNISSCFQSWV